MNIKRITFVWNADFSVAGGVRALQEVIKGEHSCTLCEIAYHRVTQTKDWKAYTKELAKRHGAEIRQPCRNQLTKEELLGIHYDYPAVLIYTDNGIKKALGSQEINSCNGKFDEFKVKLDQAINEMMNT